MAKLTLTDGTIFEGTTEEIFAITERVNGVKSDKTEAEALKVGDYAVVIGGGWYKHGSIVKITQLGGWTGSSAIRVLVDDGNNELSLYKKDIHKATDEEVAEAKAKAEASEEQARKDAIFTQVGREPNEYRKGDIVVVTSGMFGKRFYGEIVGYLDGIEYQFEEFGKSYPSIDRASDMSPIAFVESRLDN